LQQLRLESFPNKPPEISKSLASFTDKKDKRSIYDRNQTFLDEKEKKLTDARNDNSL